MKSLKNKSDPYSVVILEYIYPPLFRSFLVTTHLCIFYTKYTSDNMFEL